MPLRVIPFKPTTDTYLDSLFQSVFIPLQFGQSATVISFAGAGKWANIRFIIDHSNDFSEQYPQTAYLYINAKDFAFSPLEEIKNGMTFLLAKATIQHNTLAQSFAEHAVKFDTPLSFAQSFLRLLRDYNQRLVVVVDEAESLFIPDRRALNTTTFLQNLVNIDVTKVSFLFLTKSEIATSEEQLRYLHKFYSQHIVTERQIPFTPECSLNTLRLLEHQRGLTITETAKAHLVNAGSFDPLILKFLCLEYGTNPSFARLLDTHQSLSEEELYIESNPGYLDERYYQLLSTLSPTSKDFLYGIEKTPSPFLVNSGIVDDQGKIKLPLFQHYISARSSRYNLTTSELLLTPREERVLKLLLDSLGNIVSREAIAESLWGESWKSQYSEESVDKVVSSIRNKLSNSSQGISYSIKSAKGLGVVAERRR